MIFVVCIFGRPNWKPNFEANPKIESWNFITHDHFPNPILIIRFFLRENGVARNLDYYCIDIKEKTVFSILFHLKQDSMRSKHSVWKSKKKYHPTLKIWIFGPNSVTRHCVNRTKMGGKLKKKSNGTFVVIFKHCVPKEDFSMDLSN